MMPVTVQKRGGKYRVVEAANNNIATNARGTPVDGGGHDSREKAAKQARAINASVKKK